MVQDLLDKRQFLFFCQFTFFLFNIKTSLFKEIMKETILQFGYHTGPLSFLGDPIIDLQNKRKQHVAYFQQKNTQNRSVSFRLKTKLSKKLSLGEYGRQRTSKKFHDLVLNLRFQNSRVLETTMFQVLFSQRKVLLFS